MSVFWPAVLWGHWKPLRPADAWNVVCVANNHGLPRLLSCWKILECCQLSQRLIRVSPLIQDDNYGPSVCVEVQARRIRLPPAPNYRATIWFLHNVDCRVQYPSALITARSFPTSKVYSLFCVYKGHYMYTHQPLLFLARWETVDVFVRDSECTPGALQWRLMPPAWTKLSWQWSLALRLSW